MPPILHKPPLGMSLHEIMEKVEKIQYQAALAVTGAWQGSNRVKLYEELGWETLSDRRMCKRVLQIHKIVDNKTPSYLHDKLPPNRNKLINLPNIFQAIKCRTGRYENSFFPNAISTWNNIVSNFQHLPTFERLKSHIISLIRPEKRSTYNVLNLLHLRHLFQLRVGLSHLRSHKKRHNFIDTPSDICLCKNGVEDTRHFLLYCPFYKTHRATLVACVNEILHRKNLTSSGNMIMDTYLYGHPLLNTSDNRQILTTTLEFIKNTNRFTT